LIIFIVSAFTMYPLINLRHINALRYTSIIAIVLIAFNALIIIVKSAQLIAAPTWDPSQIVYFKVTTKTIASLPVISFAFTFHANVPPIWQEMKDPSKKNILASIWSSVITCFTVYLSVALLGYLAFLDSLGDNILLELKQDPIVNIGKIGYAFIICFSYPVIAYPIREAIDLSLFPRNQPPTRLRITLEALFIYLTSFLLGITVPGISVAFGLTGSTVGGMVVFIIPSLSYLVLKQSPIEEYGKFPWWVYRFFSLEKWGALAVLLLGVFVMIGGTYSVIAELVSG